MNQPNLVETIANILVEDFSVYANVVPGSQGRLELPEWEYQSIKSYVGDNLSARALAHIMKDEYSGDALVMHLLVGPRTATGETSVGLDRKRWVAGLSHEILTQALELAKPRLTELIRKIESHLQKT